MGQRRMARPAVAFQLADLTLDSADHLCMAQLEAFDGILVPGGFGKRGIEGMLVAIRYARGAARQVPAEQVGSGLHARRVRQGPDVCIVAVGRMVEAAEDAALLLEDEGIGTTVWDARVVKPLDPNMICDAAA